MRLISVCFFYRYKQGPIRRVCITKASTRTRASPAPVMLNVRSHKMSGHNHQHGASNIGLRRVLSADFAAGAVVGCALLTLSTWLESVYAIPRMLILVMGSAGLLYASLALSLLFRPVPSPRLVAVLGLANLMWAVFCVVAAILLFRSASWLGLAHLALEAGFVSWLGVTELRLRSGCQAVEAPQGTT